MTCLTISNRTKILILPTSSRCIETSIELEGIKENSSSIGGREGRPEGKKGRQTKKKKDINKGLKYKSRRQGQ